MPTLQYDFNKRTEGARTRKYPGAAWQFSFARGTTMWSGLEINLFLLQGTTDPELKWIYLSNRVIVATDLSDADFRSAISNPPFVTEV
jgi:hypothetical protein